jgi:hypothetical protein
MEANGQGAPQNEARYVNEYGQEIVSKTLWASGAIVPGFFLVMPNRYATDDHIPFRHRTVSQMWEDEARYALRRSLRR